jgi:gas vesicle protein
MEKSNNTGKLIGSLLVGAAIGAALGILFAPNKGSETRKKLLSKGEDLKDAVSDKLNHLRNEVSKDGEMLKNKAKEALDHSSSKS